MASTSPTPEPYKGARTSLPVLSKRSSPAQRLSYGSSSRGSSRDLDLSRSSSAAGTVQRLIPSSKSTRNIAKPPVAPTHRSAVSRLGIGRLCSIPGIPGRTGSSASSNLGKTSSLPRTQQSTGLPIASKVASPYGHLTPINVLGRSSLYMRDSPAAPKGPRQHQQAKPPSAPTQTPSKKASPYVGSHVADPCIPGCLVHHLSPCGHKVMTTRPEPCASNCRRPLLQQAVSKFANILKDTEPFVCAACVEIHIQTHRDMKRTLFAERMNGTELQMGGFPADWREQQSEYWQRVWENDVEAERAQFEKLGRKCHFVPGEPLRVGGVLEPVACPSAPALWPPSKRPLARRNVRRADRVSSEETSLASD